MKKISNRNKDTQSLITVQWWLYHLSSAVGSTSPTWLSELSPGQRSRTVTSSSPRFLQEQLSSPEQCPGAAPAKAAGTDIPGDQSPSRTCPHLLPVSSDEQELWNKWGQGCAQWPPPSLSFPCESSVCHHQALRELKSHFNLLHYHLVKLIWLSHQDLLQLWLEMYGGWEHLPQGADCSLSPKTHEEVKMLNPHEGHVTLLELTTESKSISPFTCPDLPQYCLFVTPGTGCDWVTSIVFQ